MRRKVNSRVVVALGITLLVLFAFPIGTYCQQKAYSRRELLQRIRDNSKDNSISISDFARLITQNGVDFEVTPQDEAALRKAGAADEVIMLIRSNFRPPRSLVVKSSPVDCKVLVDGQPRGTTGASGTLVVRNLVGSHKILLQKKDYRDEQRTITVLPGGLVESFSLTPLPAKLNITVNVVGAQITIHNVGSYTDKVADLELPPSSYDVEVSKPGYWPESKMIMLSPGFPYSWPVILRKMSLEEMLKAGEAALRRGDTNEAMSAFQAAAAEQPNNPKVSKLIGIAYFNSHQYESSTNYLAAAIAHGEPVSFRVKHRHSPILLCTGIITLTSKTFAFKSEDGYQAGHDFEIPYDKFKEYMIIDEILGAHLHTKARIPKPGGRKGEDEKDQNFYVPDTKYPSYEPCPACVRQLRVIFDLMKRFAAGGGNSPTLSEEGADAGTPGRPTLTRRPADQINGENDRNMGREPVLVFAGRESFKSGQRNWTRYKLTVANHAAYTEDMFMSAPDLPPCGLNTKASRTWVDIFDASGKRLNGFCALGSANDLVGLWFALPEEAAPPSQVYIVLVDRQLKVQYKSNLAAIT